VTAASEPQPAYVLHARPYRETSLLIEFFTAADGRVGALARGVRGPRGQPLRAALQPLQPMLLSLRGRGELPMVAAAEVQAGAVTLSGDRLLAALYVNELLVRLLPRQDPMPALFGRYCECLGDLAGSGALHWTLRRFERDLLDALGYGLQLHAEDDGSTPIDPDTHYRYDSEHGPRPIGPPTPGSLSGAALIALAEDTEPPADCIAPLRRLLREQLRRQLGDRELRSWTVLAELGRK